MTNRR